MTYRRGIHNVYLQTAASATVPSALSSMTLLGQTTIEGVRDEFRIEKTPIKGHTLGNTKIASVIAGYDGGSMEFTLNSYNTGVSTVDPFLQWLNSFEFGDLGPNVGQLIDASLQRTLLIAPLFSVSGHDKQRIYYRAFPSDETVKRCLFDPRDIVRNPIVMELYPHFITNKFWLAQDLASPLT